MMGCGNAGGNPAGGFMRTVRMVIEYDGTDFRGWQEQQGFRTVQGTLTEAVSRVLNRPVEIFGASRTDAGVHAAGQVVHFRTDSPIPAEKWPFLLNPTLPPDVTVKTAEDAPDSFHARFSTLGKQYEYTILSTVQPSALWRNRAFHVYRPLDADLMRVAAFSLIGEHDFAAFRDVGCEAGSTIRTLHRMDIHRNGPFLHILVEGNAFLYHMVRILAGTLVDIGSGRLPADIMPELLNSGDRRKGGQTAPAHGLCLKHVFYGDASGHPVNGRSAIVTDTCLSSSDMIK